jgi:hypothetical protein
MEKENEHVGLAQAQGPNVEEEQNVEEGQNVKEGQTVEEGQNVKEGQNVEEGHKVKEGPQNNDDDDDEDDDDDDEDDDDDDEDDDDEDDDDDDDDEDDEDDDDDEPESHVKKEKHPSKLINHGQYGCIYKPQIGCEEDEDDDDDNYVSKIQEKTEELEKEINTGKIIQSIDNYFFYYAPIIKSCDVKISNIDINILRDCAVALNENREINTVKKYASNKIRYISKYTISDYIQQLSSKENFKRIANVHLYLLEYSIPKLLQKNIIHLDLKTNNIMWDEKQEIPIMIDFGLSINMGEVLDPQKSPDEKIAIYKKYFIGEEYYIFWCVDIHMISQIVQLYETTISKDYSNQMKEMNISKNTTNISKNT